MLVEKCAEGEDHLLCFLKEEKGLIIDILPPPLFVHTSLFYPQSSLLWPISLSLSLSLPLAPLLYIYQQ